MHIRRRHRTLRRAVTLVLVATLGLAPALPIARADGGAPVAAYVTGGGPDNAELVVVNIAQRRVAARVRLSTEPQALALSADGTSVYVAEPAAGRVVVINAYTLATIQTIAVGGQPAGIVFDTAVTSDLFVTDRAGNHVSVIDPRTLRVVARLPVGLHPAGLALAGPSSGIADWTDPEIYVANADSNTVSVISIRDLRLVASIAVPGGPESIVVPALGGVAYVGTRSGTIVALSLLDHRVLGTLLRLRGSAPAWMDYDAVTSEIYVPDGAANALDVLAPASSGSDGSGAHLPPEPVHTYTLAGSPAAVAITSDGAYALVTQPDRGSLAILDGASGRTLATIGVGGQPAAVVTGPNLPVSTATSGSGTRTDTQADTTGAVLREILLVLALLSVVGFVAWRFVLRANARVRR